MTGWMEHKDKLTNIARQIEPHVILASKNAWPFQVSATFLWLLSFGKFDKTLFFKEWATTLGPYIGMPECWDYQSAQEVVIHESRHARQARWCGLGISPWLGFPIMFLIYALIFFPVLLAWGRYRLELDADAYSWRYFLDRKMWIPSEIRKEAIKRAELIASVGYFWAIPYKWALWGYQRKAEKIIAEFEKVKTI
jgi:hypothetical protein